MLPRAGNRRVRLRVRLPPCETTVMLFIDSHCIRVHTHLVWATKLERKCIISKAAWLTAVRCTRGVYFLPPTVCILEPRCYSLVAEAARDKFAFTIYWRWPCWVNGNSLVLLLHPWCLQSVIFLQTVGLLLRMVRAACPIFEP